MPCLDDSAACLNIPLSTAVTTSQQPASSSHARPPCLSATSAFPVDPASCLTLPLAQWLLFLVRLVTLA
ncbi:uncharacterized protein LY79DRAFT_551170 [Colletotrichum navitas]|uniref:Uncharacterized protein n=1 Tax=Colletotrichum navitas TaxID=681940 RepID=A0AAD8Q2Z6_9PEZI|nr:uncharacterized protein LY79DRAFT_551170 [Colletotrichum navitas]KAK1593879.1 hypothetical protein LY79DRAFT_551170 [Colletotrichum navitas]